MSRKAVDSLDPSHRPSWVEDKRPAMSNTFFHLTTCTIHFHSITLSTMGNDISHMIDNSAADEVQAKEQLEIMMKLADARLDTFQSEMDMMFLDKDCALFTPVFIVFYFDY